MYKFKEMILMLCFILSGALCYAHGEAGMEKKGDGLPFAIDLIEKTGVSGSDRSASILPSINGHVLTVVFNENLGQVSIEVATITGAVVDVTSVITPNGLQLYLPYTGDYIVTFTLPNGDVYGGEFTVTD